MSPAWYSLILYWTRLFAAALAQLQDRAPLVLLVQSQNRTYNLTPASSGRPIPLAGPETFE